MTLHIYNTHGRQKIAFQPLKKGCVTMYVCGPTVYDFLHVGNFRGAVFFNLVRNWLETLKFKVTYTYNYTDVDDKIIQKANKEGVSTREITEKYVTEFQHDFESLGLKAHSHNPKVTEHMDAIIQLIERLVAQEKAYVVKGEVFFSIKSFKAYGALSGRHLEDLEAGFRVDPSPHKKDPLDFVLWKPAKEGEPGWDSPWGKGRPGWHIECSALIFKTLGETIDIHGGGVDLVFPHHENEIAQGTGATGKPFANVWMHNAFIEFGKEKMSKSKGNVVLARDFIQQVTAEGMKFMLLQVHYRSVLLLDRKQIAGSLTGLARIYSALAWAEELCHVAESKADPKFKQTLAQLQSEAVDAMNDDFNTPQVFARLFEAVRAFNAAVPRNAKPDATGRYRAECLKEFIAFWGRNLALFKEDAGAYLKQLDDLLLKEKKLKRSQVDHLIQERSQARSKKDFKRADQLRKQLLDWGIDVQDTPKGTYWEVNKVVSA